MNRPDFQQPITFDKKSTIFYPFEGRGPHLYTPDRLQVALLADGKPDFRLQIYRGQNPTLPPQPYGILDICLDMHYPLDLALTYLREGHPYAQLEPAIFSEGYLRLYSRGAVDWPFEVRQPKPLSMTGVRNTRFLLRLTLDGALFLKKLLQDKVLPFMAQVELEMAGIAPRLPIRARFDPSQLFTVLKNEADEEGRIGRNHLVHLFKEDLTVLGLELEGEISNKEETAETLTDWIRTRFGTFVAAPSADKEGCLKLNFPDLGTGRVEWNLSQPMETWRPFVLNLQPFEAVSQAVQAHGIEAIVPPPVIVPPLHTGVYHIEVSTNIPEIRPGVLTLGVTIQAKPRAPTRPQAVTVSTELVSNSDLTNVKLILSPGEQLNYTYKTFVILEDSLGIRQFDGAEMDSNKSRLLLTPDDFPVRFVPLAANDDLLDISTIQGRCHWQEEGLTVLSFFEIDFERKEIAIPIPTMASDAKFEFEVHARDGDMQLVIGPIEAKPLILGLHTFSEYGPHQVIIELAETTTDQLVAIELLAEGRPETSEEMTILALTASQPRKFWSYFASSPFHYRYRYRLYKGVNNEFGPWSELQSPFKKLVILPELQ